jgi:hypothetical protein
LESLGPAVVAVDDAWWMADFEGERKAIAELMTLGQPVTLSSDDQRLISFLASKT